MANLLTCLVVYSVFFMGLLIYGAFGPKTLREPAPASPPDGAPEPAPTPAPVEPAERRVGRALVTLRSKTSATARWVLSPGPDFLVGPPGANRRPAGWRDLSFGQGELDDRFDSFIRFGPSTGVLDAAFPAEVLHALADLPGATVKGKGWDLTLRWESEGDAARSDDALTLLGRIAASGLRPLETAERMPNAEVSWPSPGASTEKTAEARFQVGSITARLGHWVGRWRLVGPFDGRWEAFKGTVVAGRAGDDWPRGVLRDLGVPVNDLGDAEVFARAQQIEIRFARPPERAALEAGLRLIARAAAPPPTGAFR
ncbi:MAG: hypothetical protein AAGH15_18975 [Myxococcota bacterium]